MPARILHVDLDAFFVEVCRRHHPELRTIELLVVGGRRDQRGVVQSASYGARSFGIHAGMPIAEAVRLCPQATFFQGSFVHYRDASRAVRDLLQNFSPKVVMASLDEAYLDFAGTERLYPVSLLPIAEQLRNTVQQETGLDCSVGIGPNRMIAKLASDYAKPRGLMEVRAGWEEGFLAGGRVGPGGRVPDSEDGRARAGASDWCGRAAPETASAGSRWNRAQAATATKISQPGDHTVARCT
jgi:DNA polymerase IV